MQKVKSWLPLIGLVSGFGLLGNGAYTISDALSMGSSNISVLAQGVGSAIAGLICGGAGWIYKGTKPSGSTFTTDMKSVKQLAKSLEQYEDASEPLRAISDIALQKEMEPGD